MAGNPLASLPGLPQRPSLARSSASETRLTQPGIEAARSRKLNSAPTAASRITDLFLVEPQLFELMDHPGLESADLSSLRTLTHIGASAPPTLRLRAHRRFGARVVHT